jgi:hypothetical protein
MGPISHALNKLTNHACLLFCLSQFDGEQSRRQTEHAEPTHNNSGQGVKLAWIERNQQSHAHVGNIPCTSKLNASRPVATRYGE